MEGTAARRQLSANIPVVQARLVGTPKVDMRGQLTISPTWVEADGPLERIDDYALVDFLCYFTESSVKDPSTQRPVLPCWGAPWFRSFTTSTGRGRPVDEQQTPWNRLGRCAKSRRE